MDIKKEYYRLIEDTIDYLKTGFSSRERGPSFDTFVGDAKSKKEGMNKLNKDIKRCTECELHRSRKNAVPGEGNIDADIIFIGEGPGEVEDNKGRPFVGKAGQLLTRMLTAINLKREEVYITNIVKCRPPNNRTPLPEEVETCILYLKRQIELINPLIICCLGGPAVKALTGSNLGISKLRGTFHRYPGTDGGIPLIATYHPAAVLRFPERYKRAVWNDLKMLRDFYKDIKTDIES